MNDLICNENLYLFSSDHFLKTFRLEPIFPLAIPSRRNCRDAVAVDIKKLL